MIVKDTTPPTLSLPPGQTIEATGPNGAIATFTASATDLVDGAVHVSCAPASGSTFALRNTPVTCTASDRQGNSASGSFSVVVSDTRPPALALPSGQTIEATGPNGAIVTFTASATDLVDGAVQVSCSPPSGSTFALGNATVACSASDRQGNAASGSFSVIVRDTTAPTLSLPPNQTLEATGPTGAVATFVASAADVVDGAVQVICTPASGATFAPGTTTVNCRATDRAGNAGVGAFALTVNVRTPTITSLSCTPSAPTGQSVSCLAAVSGTTSSTTWSAAGGSPPSGSGLSFSTSFAGAGSFTITFQACNGPTACASGTPQTVSVTAPAVAGTFIKTWGTTGSSAGQFNNVHGVAVDAAGNVYATDNGNNRIQKFTSNGAFIRSWGGLPLGASDGQFNDPYDVAVDTVRNWVYVVDYNNNRIQKFDLDGNFILKWGGGPIGAGEGQFSTPSGVAVDPAGNVYVADFNNQRIQEFTSTGVFIRKWGGPGAAAGQFDKPLGVAVDSANNVYVADAGNNRIQEFTSSGTFLRQWGGAGTGDGQLAGPHGIAIDVAGNVYVADQNNSRVQKFTSSGTFMTKWGTLGGGDGQFNLTAGIAVDRAGNAYVADWLNNRIEKFLAGP